MQFFSKDALAFRDQFNNLRKVQSICLCGLFVAAYVALSFFNLKLTPYLEFRFAFLAVAAQNFCQNFSKLLTKLFGKYFRYL